MFISFILWYFYALFHLELIVRQNARNHPGLNQGITTPWPFACVCAYLKWIYLLAYLGIVPGGFPKYHKSCAAPCYPVVSSFSPYGPILIVVAFFPFIFLIHFNCYGRCIWLEFGGLVCVGKLLLSFKCNYTFLNLLIEVHNDI